MEGYNNPNKQTEIRRDYPYIIATSKEKLEVVGIVYKYDKFTQGVIVKSPSGEIFFIYESHLPRFAFAFKGFMVDYCKNGYNTEYYLLRENDNSLKANTPVFYSDYQVYQKDARNLLGTLYIPANYEKPIDKDTIEFNKNAECIIPYKERCNLIYSEERLKIEEREEYYLSSMVRVDRAGLEHIEQTYFTSDIYDLKEEIDRLLKRVFYYGVELIRKDHAKYLELQRQSEPHKNLKRLLGSVETPEDNRAIKKEAVPKQKKQYKTAKNSQAKPESTGILLLQKVEKGGKIVGAIVENTQKHEKRFLAKENLSKLKYDNVTITSNGRVIPKVSGQKIPTIKYKEEFNLK